MSDMLRTDVYDQIRDRLFTGALKTGQFVSQRELADLLGATLNPVREAIRRLEGDGLINVYPQRGIQIIEGGPKEINDAYDYRLLIEIAALRGLCASEFGETVDVLRSENSAMLAAMKQNPSDQKVRQRALEADFEFHRRIVDELGNGVISRHYSLNAAKLRLFRINTGEPLSRLDIAAAEHRSILDAVQDRDVDGAIALLSDHIEVSREHTLGIRPIKGRRPIND